MFIVILRGISAEAMLDQRNENRVKTTALAIGEIFVRVLARQIADQRPCLVACHEKGAAGCILQIAMIFGDLQRKSRLLGRATNEQHIGNTRKSQKKLFSTQSAIAC